MSGCSSIDSRGEGRVVTNGIFLLKHKADWKQPLGDTLHAPRRCSGPQGKPWRRHSSCSTRCPLGRHTWKAGVQDWRLPSAHPTCSMLAMLHPWSLWLRVTLAQRAQKILWWENTWPCSWSCPRDGVILAKRELSSDVQVPCLLRSEWQLTHLLSHSQAAICDFKIFLLLILW
jgi:hypothetical protein